MYELYFDGSCEPINPNGTMGLGFLVKKDGVVIETYSHKIPRGAEGFFVTTNNIAEYLSLRRGLEYCIANHIRTIKVYGDSQLVIKQMQDLWGASSGAYISQLLACKKLLRHFTKIEFKWIPREQNTEADKLSKNSENA
jgi:ribonuclease HI